MPERRRLASLVNGLSLIDSADGPTPWGSAGSHCCLPCALIALSASRQPFLSAGLKTLKQLDAALRQRTWPRAVRLTNGRPESFLLGTVSLLDLAQRVQPFPVGERRV